MIRRWWREEKKGPELGHIAGKHLGDRLALNSEIRRFSIELPANTIEVRNAGENAEFDIDGRLITLENPGFKVEDGSKFDAFDALTQYYQHDVSVHGELGWFCDDRHTERHMLSTRAGEVVPCLSWMLAMPQKGTELVASMRMTFATVLEDSFLLLRGDVHGDISNERLDDMADYLEQSLQSLRRGSSILTFD